MNDKAKKIIEVVSEVFEADIMVKSRAYKYSNARVVAYFFLHEIHFNKSEISRMFGLIPSTVVHALKHTFPSLKKYDVDFIEKFKICQTKLYPTMRALTNQGEQKRCYIAGKISGLKAREYRGNFERAEKKVRNKGYIPVVPIELPHVHDKKWESYMRECISALMGCHSIYMMKDYRNSTGALIELEIAKKLNFEIIYEQNECRKVSNIGELQTDEKGDFRLINDKKIYQIEEKDNRSQKINDAINEKRASGKSSHEWLLGR